jgi:quercetin dioxygenase-like cupin family protein
MHATRERAVSTGHPLHRLPELQGRDVLGLLPERAEGEHEITFGEVVLRSGEVIAPHRTNHPELGYLLEGSIRVWREGGSVELSGRSAFYIPANEVSAIACTSEQPARILLGYAHGGTDREMRSQLRPKEELVVPKRPNVIPFGPDVARWAVAEDFCPWIGVEPSKGSRQQMRILLDASTGTPDFVAGSALDSPHTHYTMHRHAPGEIYYVVEGTGIIYVGDAGWEVNPGDTVYVPAMVPHGIDTHDVTLDTYWFYATDMTSSWEWEPVEPIYTSPPRRSDVDLLSDLLSMAPHHEPTP